MIRANKIIEVARQYLGIIENPGNTGWKNTAFQNMMVKVGWYLKAAWCAFFTKAVYLEAYADNPAVTKAIKNCFTGGALDTYRRVKADGTFKTGSEPKKGAIAVYQHGNGSTGHVGIVENELIAPNTQQNIEGNTNASGSREGDRVAEKLRTIKRDKKADGLNLVGFIYPIED
ncbi:CHAP domain-containing protein [Pedobacter zeae]|uniref:Peptidase C51 domain-containing protein n=1 Tax=Pedobacter zeae TaxID=1737356 RepID=A0A7W6K9Q3_9SPHI|nr:CHAP domain-containing protein [Pedobacter zeae]MBB4106622.1 hypothetical protein [Pedobacter zeae]GGH02766.1 hypothetical protein GCM10007422_17420 [Pedobacter zeae]